MWLVLLYVIKKSLELFLMSKKKKKWNLLFHEDHMAAKGRKNQNGVG